MNNESYSGKAHGYRYESNDSLDTGGSFKKSPDEIVYKWTPSKQAKKLKLYKSMQYLAVSILAMLLSIFLMTFPSDFESEILQRIWGSFDYKTLFAVTGLGIGAVLFVVLQYQMFVNQKPLPSSFVDIDERASSSKIDQRLSELRQEFLQFKASRESGANNTQEEVAVDVPKAEFHQSSAIEYYINGLTKSLDMHIETSDKKASKLLDTGTMYLRRGIYFYVASIFVWQLVAHIWGVNKPLIYGVISCSLTFLVVEFLAAWFLRQYRSFIDSSVQFMKAKSVFDRYMLSYYAIKEFSVEGAEGMAESKIQILKVLAEEIKWPEALNSKSGNMNHMVEMFESLSGLLDKVKKVSSKNDQTIT